MRIIIRHFKKMFALTGIFIFIFFTQNISAQSLKQTIDLALSGNPNIKAGQEEVRQAELSFKSTFRKTLPQINFDASYRHVTDVAELTMPSIMGMPGESIRLGTYDTYETGLTANYLLFTGFAQQSSARMKEKQKDLSAANLEKTKKDIVFKTIASYRQAQNYQLEIASLNAGQERTKLQLKRIKSLTKHGMALPLDTLSLALAKLSFDQRLIAVQASLESAKEQLQNLTGQTINVQDASYQDHPNNLAELNIEQVENIKGLSIQKNILELNKTIIKSSYYPAIALYAGLKYGKPGVDMIENDWMTYGIWGVNVSWNLWNWTGDRAAVQAKQAQIRQIAYQKEALQDQICTVYDNAVREFKSMQKQLNVFAASLNLARHKMKIIESQFQQGMVSVTDFNDTNLELTEAELNHKQHLIRIALKANEIDYISAKPISEWRIEQ